jgi:poly-gamma-glutamate synthesis protein (capsule biosynthesis protein)
MKKPTLFFVSLLLLSFLSACQLAAVSETSLPTQEVNFDPPAIPTRTHTPFLPQQTMEVPTSPTPPPSLTPTFTSTSLPQITLLFTGVIVPARCVQAGIDARGDPHYLYDEVRHLIREADLAVGTLNATISDYAPRTGCVVTYVLVGGSQNADALAEAGFDVMSVATNHIKNCGIGDCGNRAFYDTLDNLRRVGITPVGAGENLVEAMQPIVVTIEGVRFGIVSLGMVEPMAFASEQEPGIAVLNDENLYAAIQAARPMADVVIAMPHWGPEDSPNPNEYQLHFAQVAVDAGADLVVGNHTHVVQAIQQINEVDVFYGLGNFVFDQNWDLAHQQGVILLVKFEGSRYLGSELIPTHVDMDGTVHLANEEEAAQILARIQHASDRHK